ncbi:MAG TPA: arginine repressor [Gelria sp.]|jgi:transcriptional regulator of arginine metabolism|nr:arginine repressor [Gelria sp.]
MKVRRRFSIIDIISSQRVSTQEELCEILKNIGYDVTQATVSRDIKELQLIKISDNEGYYYALPDNSPIQNSRERMHRLFKDSVISIDYSENIVVIKTLPGAAQSIALLIDTAELENVLGTVAGDDTIMVVVKPLKAVKEIVEEFEELINS